MSTADDPWLSTEQVAERLGFDPATLRNWRRAGYGPLAVPFGGKQRYRESAVEEFERQQTAAAREVQAQRAKTAKTQRSFAKLIGGPRGAEAVAGHDAQPDQKAS